LVRVKLAGLIALAVATIVALSGAARASDGITLRGYGTAVVDGLLSPGEWDAAGHYDFQANRAPAEGGGTVPATLFVMNDSANLYLALRVSVTNLGYSAFDGIFPAPDPNPFGPGNDILRATPTSFEDIHWHPVGPNNWDWLADVADGGTRDGVAAVHQSGGVGVFEVAHPLNSADDQHDFSLTIPKHVRFIGSFQHCVASACATTFMPPTSLNQVVVVSGTHIPPDTSITAGPAEGSQVPDYGNFEFVGTDDVTPPSELEYECKVDDEDWSSCDSPFGPATTVDGWHALSIRALDDMLNADPTPAQRHWRIDTQSPSKPKVIVSRRRGAAVTELRLSATDRGTPAKRLRFRCAVDSKRLHACASRYRLRLRAGRHVLRVRAVDPAGNQSDARIARFAVRLPAA
jgi:hypothetical protein